MRNTRVNARYWEVANRIVDTRSVDIELFIWQHFHVPLAGLVDFDAALTGW